MLSTFTLLGTRTLCKYQMTNCANMKHVIHAVNKTDLSFFISPFRHVHHANARSKWHQHIGTGAERAIEPGTSGNSHANESVVGNWLNGKLFAPTCFGRSIGRFKWQRRQLDGFRARCFVIRWRMEWSWERLGAGISFVSYMNFLATNWYNNFLSTTITAVNL